MSSILFTAWGYDVSILEFISALTSMIGVGLGVTGRRITWPWWALSSVLYGFFFLDVELYASAALQIIFVLAAIWGWFGWGPQGAIPARLGNQERINWFYGLLLGCIISTPLLAYLGAAATWSDAFLFFGSLIAQVLMVYEKFESWTIWLLVDAVGTIQYALLGYWFTAVLYFIFTIIALIGWKRWYESHRSTVGSM
jgi:nicotinamide mononucleotide transporter